MKKVLILGANGQIARLARQQLLAETDDELTLFLRNASRISDASARETVVDGDASDPQQVLAAVQGQDAVYANLDGANIVDQAKTVIKAMDEAGVKRLVWISTLGIYDEVPGDFGRRVKQYLSGGYLETYAEAAKAIEDSDLNYTIIRPAALVDEDVVDYEVTTRHEAFKGEAVSRKSVADLVVKLIADDKLHSRDSLGVDQPGSVSPFQA